MPNISVARSTFYFIILSFVKCEVVCHHFMAVPAVFFGNVFVSFVYLNRFMVIP